jgi:Serine dehydratase beta chain
VRTSLFDLFKIGIGPFSSHTMGPMRAARAFVERLEAAGKLGETDEVTAMLYGSLALTGVGHSTDCAVLLGVAGERPEELDPEVASEHVAEIRSTGRLLLLGVYPTPFEESRHLIFHKDLVLPGHPNGMRFSAGRADASLLAREVYFSIGGGFIQREGDQLADTAPRPPVPYPFPVPRNCWQPPTTTASPYGSSCCKTSPRCTAVKLCWLTFVKSGPPWMAPLNAAWRPTAPCPAASMCGGARPPSMRACATRTAGSVSRYGLRQRLLDGRQRGECRRRSRGDGAH